METRSDIYGDFEFEGLGKKTRYILTVEHEGYQPANWNYLPIRALTWVRLCWTPYKVGWPTSF